MIVGLGCLAHDNVLVTETTWTAGKGRIVRRETRFGGNVRNALATVAALDHPAAYLATVGTSSLGDEAIADLLEHHIDTRFIERIPGADPVVSVLTITADGERYVAFDDDSLSSTPLPSTASVEAALSLASVLLVDAPTAPPGSLDVGLLTCARVHALFPTWHGFFRLVNKKFLTTRIYRKDQGAHPMSLTGINIAT